MNRKFIRVLSVNRKRLLIRINITYNRVRHYLKSQTVLQRPINTYNKKTICKNIAIYIIEMGLNLAMLFFVFRKSVFLFIWMNIITISMFFVMNTSKNDTIMDKK